MLNPTCAIYLQIDMYVLGLLICKPGDITHSIFHHINGSEAIDGPKFIFAFHIGNGVKKMRSHGRNYGT